MPLRADDTLRPRISLVKFHVSQLKFTILMPIEKLGLTMRYDAIRLPPRRALSVSDYWFIIADIRRAATNLYGLAIAAARIVLFIGFIAGALRRAGWSSRR